MTCKRVSGSSGGRLLTLGTDAPLMDGGSRCSGPSALPAPLGGTTGEYLRTDATARN